MATQATVADMYSVQTATNWANGSGMSLTDAMSYINGAWTSFQNMGPAIISLQHQAATIASAAQQQGNTAVYNDMESRIQTLGSLNNLVGSAYDKLDTLESLLAQAGLDLNGNPNYTGTTVASPSEDVGFGQDPITISGTALVAALALVAVIVYVNYHYNEQSQAIAAQSSILQQVASGAITPQQGAAMMQTVSQTAAQSQNTGIAGIFGNVKTIAIVAAIAAVAIVLIPPAGAVKRAAR